MKRSHSWPVVATFVVIILEMVGAILLSTLIGDGPGIDATAYATVLFVLATGAVGTLIGLRRAGNTIGWLLRLAAFGFATGSLLVIYVEVSVAQPGSLPLGPMVVIANIVQPMILLLLASRIQDKKTAILRQPARI